MLEPDQERLRFGPFELDRRSGELRRGGIAVPLARQPFRLLAALAGRPGEVVTREELRLAVWGEETFVDFERGLNFCVLQARAALGDDARNPAYIETLPKRGYRFVARLESVEPHSPPAAVRPWGSLRIAAVFLIALVIGSGALAIQPEIAGRIAAVLGMRIQAALPPMTAKSARTHDAYLRGRQLWHDGRLEESAASLREAIRIEPDYVLPHIALAETVHSLAMARRMAPAVAAAEIRRAADSASRLAPSLPQTHAVRAMLAFWYDWRFDEAEESYREAIRLNPREPGALHDHGWLLIARGNFESGLAEIRRAQALDPLSARANTHVAWAYIFSRRFRDAEREAARAKELQPGYREADACIHQVALLERRVQPAGEIHPKNPYGTAARLAMRGDRQGAVEWLRVAKDRRDTQFILAAADPKFESLHGDPGFIALLDSVGLAPVRPRGD